ncbi:MAG TPA: enoyl-CoA hydratase-related protein [Actinomycetota bacterium]|nr:enoyl-CoA hydratase-related protein [Actinomycetota bacterium]
MTEAVAGHVGRRREGRVEVITLDRPDALNALSDAMVQEVARAFREVAADNDVWVVLLAASGPKAFCVGADLKERGGFSLDDFYANRTHVREMFQAIRDVPQPSIASAFGFALGGGFELVLSCDLVVAAEGTKFSLPEPRVGLLPAGGGTQLLARKVGAGRAKELILRSRRIDASEAQRLGVVAEVTRRDELDRRSMDLANELCRSSPIALREAKRAMDQGFGMTLEEAIELENDAWQVVIASADRSEGIAAFNEKREPEWKNR